MKLKVLTALDHAKTQLYHFQAIIIAGMGLFTDAYDLFTITPVLKLIGRIYYPDMTTPPIISTAVISVALAGMIVGQLLFGALGDRIGRRRVYGLALLLMIFSSVGSGFSVCRTRGCVLTSLCFFRFLLGLGIGGDYPLSATIMSEFANRRTRGSFIAAVFSMQGFGILVASAVTMAAAAAFERAERGESTGTPAGADVLWRVILMMGAVPAAFTLYWRMVMPETARYTALVQQNVVRANHDIRRVLAFDPELPSIDEYSEPSVPTRRLPDTYGLFSNQFLRAHGRNLFACAAAWFLVDIPYYGSTLFQSKIYQPLFKDPHYNKKLPLPFHNAYREAYNVAKFQAIFAAASTIPGYWFSVFTIDRIGRRPIQLVGFLLISVFLFSLAGLYDAYWNDRIKNAWFLVLYAFTFFFSNFGPNTTTFIVPAELFPARLRCTCHGIAGAAGKAGAIVGSVGFLWASWDQTKDGVARSFVILGGICLAGTVITYFFTPETKLMSLEENEGSGRISEGDELERMGSVIGSSHATVMPLDHPSPAV